MQIRTFRCTAPILTSPFVSNSKPFAVTDPIQQSTTCSIPSFHAKAQHQRLSMSTLTMASVSCYVKDVMRTKRLSPPNPILESLDEMQTPSTMENLPKFSIFEPHHLQKAAEEISRQHDVELAQLEVRWTSVSEDERGNHNFSKLSSLLLDLDRLTAPVVQLREISELYPTLASTPDKIQDWIQASERVHSKTTQRFVENLYGSRIVYRALATAISNSTTTSTVPSFLIPFWKRGAHTSDAEGIQHIQNELAVLNERLDTVVSYDRASKAMRLQCMSDMYNCIGLSRLQVESILTETSHDSVWGLAKLQHHHMVESPQEELLDSLFPEIASSLNAFLPKQAKLDLEGVGAFLEGKSDVGNSKGIDSSREFLKARFDFKQRIRLHGVLQGFVDFCDQILGIRIVQDSDANNAEAGWSKNVRLLHLYETSHDANDDDDDDDTDRNGDYLGTIYFDPFADSYWRTETAKDLVKTQRFSKQITGQTTAPMAIVALKITPIWDDTPVPMTWGDTRDLLYQLGSAMQHILDQSRQRRNYLKDDHEAIEPAPIDTSDFLAHFLELWLQNDGFLHRLAQLSQDELSLDDETITLLRKDLRNEKALELTNTMFLSALQFTVFETFDPRGDETLVSLQERLAVQYLPGSNLPDPSDLSPLLAIFQQSGVDQKLSAYGTLWSEVLAATVYETFQKTDLRDRDKVHRLGTGIRDLFLRGSDGKPLSRQAFANLCETNVESIGRGGPLTRVYGFDTKDP